MDTLERIWETVSGVASGTLRGFERAVTSVFGSANARALKRFYPKVEAINALEAKFQALTDEELRGLTRQFRQRFAAGETLDDLLVEAFAVCREAGHRFLEMRHYDVQLIGGMILHSGKIAEMVTGEGKTLVATLAAYLNALSQQGVHVVTVNDYLARRDMEWMSRIYLNLGLTVGAIQSGMPADERQNAYACDITYGTNNEFGFDYLRDNMRLAARGDDRYPKHLQQAQGRLNFAIVDEVDNILVDEARTPLIISGPAEDDITKYQRADKIARQLKKDAHFEVKEKEHSAHLTEDGVREAEKLAGVESFYTAGNMQWPHLIDNSLKAHHLYKLDVNYVVQDGTIVIVDEFTGRLMHGRQWSDGLHQAVEAKEGVPIKEENQTLATITLQNYFKLYNKISGMTGTAMTEAGEFWKIYKLDVVAVPTNRPLQRLNHADVIYRTEHEKFVAIADEIERMSKWDAVLTDKGDVIQGSLQDQNESELVIQQHPGKERVTIPQSSVREVERKGRPILVGTVSIEKSERLANLLDKRGIRHEVLNAKQHKREAEIVAQAGRRGVVTIATNMAGRGTDIVLGGNPETMVWAALQDKYPTRLEVPNEEWDGLIAEISQREGMKREGDEIKQIGGLHIIGTERHEARREFNLQLRGRCGRQGDPGSSRFYLSLEDDLMRIFAGEWVKGMLTRLGMQEGEAIESRMVSRRIEGAQRKVEERNFEIRKNLLEYDEVMDEQRKRVYGYRQRILEGANCRDLIVEMIDGQIQQHMGSYLSREYGAETFAMQAGRLLGVELEPRDYYNVDFATAEQSAREEARRNAEQQVYDAIDENLPEEEEESEWNWTALAKSVNSRWDLNVRDRDLKRLERDSLAETLLPQATGAVGAIDLQACARCLDRDFGLQTACAWFHFKFGIALDPESLEGQENAQILELARERAAAAYDEREAEYPVIVGLVHFARRDASGARYDRDALVEWAGERFGQALNPDDLRNKQREEVRALLVEQSRLNNVRAHEAHQKAAEQIDSLYGQSQRLPGGINGQLGAFADWLNGELQWDVSADELAKLERDEVALRLAQTIEDRYRPEIRRMERALVLQILDTAWKDHLQMMDHLKSSISLRGYAQVDPKVEYKREGMRQFDQMWESIGEHVTNLIFKMEDLNEEFVGATWAGSEAVKEEASSGIAAEQEAALQGSDGQSDRKIEPIRNREQRVGRNQLCPCGSGKKYKNCCLRKRVG